MGVDSYQLIPDFLLILRVIRDGLGMIFFHFGVLALWGGFGLAVGVRGCGLCSRGLGCRRRLCAGDDA